MLRAPPSNRRRCCCYAAPALRVRRVLFLHGIPETPAPADLRPPAHSSTSLLLIRGWNTAGWEGRNCCPPTCPLPNCVGSLTSWGVSNSTMPQPLERPTQDGEKRVSKKKDCIPPKISCQGPLRARIQVR